MTELLGVAEGLALWGHGGGHSVVVLGHVGEVGEEVEDGSEAEERPEVVVGLVFAL